MVQGRVTRGMRSTRYSLKAMFPVCPSTLGVTRIEKLVDFERRLHLTRFNTRTMVKDRMLLLSGCSKNAWHCAINPNCIDDIKWYILYERKNHPAKKGKGRILTSYEEMDTINRVLYPNGIDELLQPPPINL